MPLQQAMNMMIVDNVMRDATVRGVQLMQGGHRVMVEVAARELTFWREVSTTKQTIQVEAVLQPSELSVSDTTLKSLQGAYVAELIQTTDSQPILVRLTAGQPPQPVKHRE